MWQKFWQYGGHYVMGLAGIAAVATLAGIHVITGDIGVPIITGIVTALIGGGLVHNATAAPAAKAPPTTP